MGEAVVQSIGQYDSGHNSGYSCDNPKTSLTKIACNTRKEKRKTRQLTC
jgi:hypothetical protein